MDRSPRGTGPAPVEFAASPWRAIAIAGGAACAIALILLVTLRKRTEPGPEGERLLRAQAAANEASAACALKEILVAQNMYRRTDWDRDGVMEYAVPFTLLYGQKDSNGYAVRYISGDLARAASRGAPLRGYWFVDMRGHQAAGAYRSGGNQPDAFGVCAVPAAYPKSGRLTLIMDATGAVYGKDNGGVPVVAFPASPRAAGWSVSAR